MKKWKIFFYNPYTEIIIDADSFDDALRKARKINPRFSGGQIIE